MTDKYAWLIAASDQYQLILRQVDKQYLRPPSSLSVFASPHYIITSKIA